MIGVAQVLLYGGGGEGGRGMFSNNAGKGVIVCMYVCKLGTWDKSMTSVSIVGGCVW